MDSCLGEASTDKVAGGAGGEWKQEAEPVLKKLSCVVFLVVMGSFLITFFQLNQMGIMPVKKQYVCEKAKGLWKCNRPMQRQ